MGPLKAGPRQLLSSELCLSPLAPGIDLLCPVARSAEECAHTALNGADSHPGSLAAHQYWVVQSKVHRIERGDRMGGCRHRQKKRLLYTSRKDYVFYKALSPTLPAC